MKKILIATLIVTAVFTSKVFADEKAEVKSDFARKNILIGSDPAIMKMMAAVAEKVGDKHLRGKPDIQLRYAKKAFKTLCLGKGAEYPDMVATIREMTAEEYKRCQNHDVGSIIKMKIGYEALVLAANKDAIDLNLDERGLFRAIANDVPDDDNDISGTLMINPNKTWKDIDSAAPKQAIKIWGPADKSRNERSVKMLAMEPGCRTWDWVAEMKFVQKSYRLYRQLCWVPRKDGLYIKAKEEGADLTKHILSEKNGIALIDFNSWQRAKEKLKGKLKAYSVNDLPPTVATISKGLYPLSRSYYVYIKMSSLKKVQGLSHFMKEVLSDEALADNGYLAAMGLVVMPDKERKKEVTQAAEFTMMTAPDPS